MAPPTDHPPLDHPLADLRAAVAKALAIDWDTVEGDQLAADTEQLLQITDRLDALRSRVTSATDRSGIWAEHGHGTCAAMLRKRAPHRHPGGVGHDVRTGKRLRQMPHVGAAFEAGLITADHVRLFGTCLHARFDQQFADFEEQLVQHAIDLTWDQWIRLMNRWKDAADRREPDKADEKDQAAREVHLSRTLGDRGVLAGTLTPHARQILRSELDRLTQQLFEQDWAEATERLGEGNVTADCLQRTPPQRRHDALVWMAQRSSGADHGTEPGDPMIYVHCTPDELEAALAEAAGLDRQPVDIEHGLREYEDGTPISRRMLTRLALRARIKRVVFDPVGNPVDISPGRRLFSQAQREAIAIRDRVCACGCRLPARLCEADHITEHRDGGLTIVANGQPLCRRSHRLKTNERNRQAGSKVHHAGPPRNREGLGHRPIT